jgi:hypothetical protein
MAPATRVRDWAEVDFYALLGLAPNATDDDIARAFRRLAKQYHPDAGAPTSDAERYKDITAAYTVLSDPSVRRDYDRVRLEVSQPAPVRTPSPHLVTRPTGAFRTAKPAGPGWTPGRAWMAIIGGIVTALLGVVVVLWILALQGRDNVEPDPGRDITLAIVAAKLLIAGPIFSVYGALHRPKNLRRG